MRHSVDCGSDPDYLAGAIGRECGNKPRDSHKPPVGWLILGHSNACWVIPMHVGSFQRIPAASLALASPALDYGEPSIMEGSLALLGLGSHVAELLRAGEALAHNWLTPDSTGGEGCGVPEVVFFWLPAIRFLSFLAF